MLLTLKWRKNVYDVTNVEQHELFGFDASHPLTDVIPGSKAETTTSSRYSSFRGRERSLDPRRLRRAVRHSQTNSASPKGLHQPSAFRSDLRRRKVRLAFCLHTASPVKDRPWYVSLSASQWLSRSGIPRPRMLDTDLFMDHWPCTSPEQSGLG